MEIFARRQRWQSFLRLRRRENWDSCLCGENQLENRTQPFNNNKAMKPNRSSKGGKPGLADMKKTDAQGCQTGESHC